MRLLEGGQMLGHLVQQLGCLHHDFLFPLHAPPELLLNSTSALGLLLRTHLLTEMQDWRTAYITLQTANCQPAPSAACPWVWQVLKPRVPWGPLVARARELLWRWCLKRGA